MNLKLFLPFVCRRLDINILSRIRQKQVFISSSRNKKLFGSFKYETVFRDRENDESKQDHHDIGNATKSSEQIKVSKHLSGMLDNLWLQLVITDHQMAGLGGDYLIPSHDISHLVELPSDDPPI